MTIRETEGEMAKSLDRNILTAVSSMESLSHTHTDTFSSAFYLPSLSLRGESI